MPRDADVYLADILEAIARISSYTKRLDVDAFKETLVRSTPSSEISK